MSSMAAALEAERWWIKLRKAPGIFAQISVTQGLLVCLVTPPRLQLSVPEWRLVAVIRTTLLTDFQVPLSTLTVIITAIAYGVHVSHHDRQLGGTFRDNNPVQGLVLSCLLGRTRYKSTSIAIRCYQMQAASTSTTHVKEGHCVDAIVSHWRKPSAVCRILSRMTANDSQSWPHAAVESTDCTTDATTFPTPTL